MPIGECGFVYGRHRKPSQGAQPSFTVYRCRLCRWLYFFQCLIRHHIRTAGQWISLGESLACRAQ